MSDGLYKSLEEATRTDQVNKDIAQMAVEQVGTEFQQEQKYADIFHVYSLQSFHYLIATLINIDIT